MNFLYNHLLAVENKGVPYSTDIPIWQRAYLPALKRLYQRRYILERQVLRLQERCAIHEKNMVRIRRYLTAAVTVEDISLGEALELSGLLSQSHDPGEAPVSNTFADMDDTAFLSYWPDYATQV